MTRTNYRIYDVLRGEIKPFVYDHPRFRSSGAAARTIKIYRAAGKMTIDGNGDGWPNIPAEVIPPDRVVEGADGDSVQASFKLCWDDENLYLLLHVTDATPRRNTHTDGSWLWSGDGAELFVGHEKLDQAGPLLFTDRQILLGAGQEPRVHFVGQAQQPECKLAVVNDVDGKGYTLEAAIPFRALGFAPGEGRKIRFDLAVDDSENGRGRLRQLMWNGAARNAGDRTYWGHAVFGK